MKFQNFKIAKLRKNGAEKRNEKDGAGHDDYVQPESNNQNRTVHRKVKGLSKVGVEAEATFYYGGPVTCSGRKFLEKITQRQENGVK